MANEQQSWFGPGVSAGPDGCGGFDGFDGYDGFDGADGSDGVDGLGDSLKKRELSNH